MENSKSHHSNKKKDKPTEPANLKTISLLPVISKIFERIINRSIVSFSEKNNIIPEYQFGFKRNHSTIHVINKLTSDINWHQSKRDIVGAGLINLKRI